MNRILIVEDEGIIARDIQQQLQSLGYDPVDVAVDGAEAIDAARALHPELVLMDIHLAGEMDGIEAATRIRHELGIPCVFLTAYATNDVVERAKAADPSGYIIKPFDAQILRTTIEIALHKDRLERQLRRSEAGLADAQKMAHIGSGDADLLTGMVAWSAEAQRILDIDAAGSPFTLDAFRALIHADDRALMVAATDEAVRGTGDYDATVRAVMPDGRIKLLRLRALVSVDGSGRPVRAVGTIQDITEQRRAEDLLRLQGAALNSTTNAVVITNRSGVIEWVNPAFSALSGYTLAEAIGHTPGTLVKSGEHDAAFYARIWETILTGRVWSGEITNRRKDGSLHAEELTITPVLDTAGAITHFVGVKRDLTEQKHLEQQFLQAQKMEVIGRLAGGVAHDFNNLLTIINGTCELALMELADGHPLRAEFEEIQGAGDRAARLTRQLLAFSRKQMLTPAVVNVAAQVAQSVKMLRRLIGEDITLEVKGDPGDNLHVFVDPSQLEQVMLNLAVNARDAMPEGGTLTIETAGAVLGDAEAAAAGVAAGQYVVLSVADTGTGMTSEVRKHIFEPFFTTKDQGKGTGLGLATVYGVIHQSGGTIDVESAPGQGARFRVFIPLVAEGAGSPAGTVTAFLPGSETILLVEDELALRDMTARMLESAGYRVVTAASGADALDVLQDEPGVSLVITDVVMPGMSGSDLARRLGAVKPDLRLLFTSGYADDRLGPLVSARNGNFVPKPYTLATLTRKVRQLLDTPGGSQGGPATVRTSSR